MLRSLSKSPPSYIEYQHSNQTRSNSSSTLKITDPFYDSSRYTHLDGGQGVMQQNAMEEKDFGGMIYNDGVEGVAGHVLTSPTQLKGGRISTISKTRSIHKALEKRSDSFVKRVDAKRTMAGISIPGMRTVFGRNPHIARRIIWILILITCFSIAVVQVQDRVLYYLSTPVRVNVRSLINDSMLRFPAISLCNKNLFNLTAMAVLKKEKASELLATFNATVTQRTIDSWDIPDLIGVRGYDATKVWDFTANSIDGMVLECFMGRNVSCKDRGAWKKVYNYMGVCYTYELDSNDPFVHSTGLFNNFYLKLIETEPVAYKNDTSGWKVLIHDTRDTPLIDIRTHGTTVYRGWGKDSLIYLRQFRTLNTYKRPCIENNNYSYSRCIANCFVAAFVQANICRLPYIDKMYNLRPCADKESYKEAMAWADKLLFYGAWTVSNCSCIRQCNQDIYLISTETTPLENPYYNQGKLRVYHVDMMYDDMEDELGYAAIPLLCDVGGSLGLLLGASVLTFFEIIEAISAALITFTHWCCRVAKLKKRSSTVASKNMKTISISSKS